MSQSMRAIGVEPGAREVKIVTESVPSLSGPTDVKLRMLEVGVCGTDKEICAFEYGTPPSGSTHLVIGHESLAEVVEVGSGVKSVKTGDLVVPTVRRPCRHEHCRACAAGRQDFCFTGDFTERGIKERHGYMTEFVVDDERYMNVVPKALREVGVLVEPLTIAEKGLIQLRNIQERLPWECLHAHKEGGWGHCHNAVVLGAGPVGLLGAMALVTRGFDTFVYSREAEDSEKAKLVRSFGAHYVSAATDSVDRLAEKAGPIDVVYEAVGAPAVVFDVLRHLGANGVFILTGVPALKGPQSIGADVIMRNMVLKNQVALGTVNAGKDVFEAAIKDLGIFVERWPSAVRALITGRFPMDAFRDLLLGHAPGIKNLIVLDGRA